MTSPSHASAQPSGDTVANPARVALVEETLDVSKRSVEMGRVRVETRVEHEEVTLNEALAHDVVEVERVPRNERVAAAPAIREEGDVLIVPVLEERLVVEKQLFLVEELRIRRALTSETVAIPVTRRVMHADVTREPTNHLNREHNHGG